MGGLKNFSIVLDSPTGAYYPGTMVTGKVLLSIEKPKTVRAINLKIEGVAKVHWSESERVRKSDGDTETETVHYNAEEEYFSNKFKLVGGGSDKTEIPIGDYVYPFSSALPPLLPSSFEGEHGSVKYTVKAVMDRPWKIDHETKLQFSVVAPLDLNYNAVAQEAVMQENEKSFCCLCCKSGPLQMVVSIPYKGYVSGQSIPLKIEVDNASNVDVDSVVCKLKKVLKYTAHRPSQKEKEDSIELCKLKLEGVAQRGSKSWNQQLSVPVMPFFNLDPCSIIKSTFHLKVEAEVSGCHSGLESTVPIIIGSVPIGQSPSVAGMPLIDQRTPPPPYPDSPISRPYPLDSSPYPSAPSPSAPPSAPPPVGFNIESSNEKTPLTPTPY